jgi:hypothetical protein
MTGLRAMSLGSSFTNESTTARRTIAASNIDVDRRFEWCGSTWGSWGSSVRKPLSVGMVMGVS